MHQVVTDGFVLSVAGAIAGCRNNFYIAIGAGESSWDGNLPDVSSDMTSLIHETARKPIAKVEYLDDNDDPVEGITAKINLVSHRFSAEDYEGPVRECGLFFVDGDTEIMVMYSVFERVDITPQLTITKNMIINLAS